MSKYLILFVINIPLLIVLYVRFTADYKTKRITRKKYFGSITLIVITALCLVLTEPAYTWLINKNLTDSQPMSVFDMILLTLIIFLVFSLVRVRQQITEHSKELTKLHEHIAIKDAE